MSTTLCPDPASRAWRRALRRRRLAVGAAAAALLATTASLPMAFASHPEASLTGSNFEIDVDANLAVDDVGQDDWASVEQTYQNDEPSGKNDNSYAGGVKEDTVCPAETTGSIPPNKSDLLQFGVWQEDGSPGFLHMYWTRVTEPSGTTLMDFEFNQSDTACTTGPNRVRTEGDLLIEYSIVQGGSRADMTLREWTGTAWDDADDLDLQGDAAGTINSTAITMQDTLTQNQSARTFGEASVDLDLIFNNNECTSFGSATLKSRSSDSFTSQLKDFIKPLDINLTNCGKVIIHKETVPAGATDMFEFTKDFGTDPATASTFQLNGATGSDTATFDNVLLGSGYTVDETDLPDGWEFDSVDCDASVGVTPSIVGSEVTFDIDDTTDVLECTYTNKALADLTIVKQVNDESGGQAFGFTTSPALDPDGFSLTPDASGQASTGAAYHGIAPGTYSVAETVPAGWNLVSQSCTGGTDTDPADGITLRSGESITCTFVNARERGAIEITKTRKHQAAGGTDAHAGVTFTVSGNGITPVAVQTDADGKACVPNLLYGSYTVTETVPAGYTGESPKAVSVSAEANCGANLAPAADVSFVNTPLTNITVSVDSQVDGGTASTIVCTDAADVTVEPDAPASGSNGDLSATWSDLLPTHPAATLVCTITVDP